MDTNLSRLNIQDDLYDMQEFETDDSSYLSRKMLRACQRIKGWHQWSWDFKSATISVVSNSLDDNRGPYDLPSDFAHLLQPERISKAWRYDVQSVATIQDTPIGLISRIAIDRLNKKLYFLDSPPTGDYTFNYKARLTSLADVDDTWPQDMAEPVEIMTKYYMLRDLPATRNTAETYLAEGRDIVTDKWNEERAGDSLQTERVHRSSSGYPIEEHLDLANESFVVMAADSL